MPISERSISRAILRAYASSLDRALELDVAVAGAGPAGLVAAWRLAEKGFRVAVFEKRLSAGGGIWGGAMGMNQVVVQKEAHGLLRIAGARVRQVEDGLGVVDAAEMVSALCLKMLRSGARFFNLMSAEDVVVKRNRVTGIVINRTLLAEKLPIDPLVFTARAVLDATGHQAVVLASLTRRDLIKGQGLKGIEGPMDAQAGEAFVAKKAGRVFPGLYLAGMSVCAAYGAPRMGPIFGGMLLSGEKAAGVIASDLRQPQSEP